MNCMTSFCVKCFSSTNSHSQINVVVIVFRHCFIEWIWEGAVEVWCLWSLLSVVIQLRLGAVLQFETHIFSKSLFFCSKNVQSYNFASCFVWVWNLVSYWERNIGWGFSRIGFRRDGVTGEWRRLHSEELNVLYRHQILFGWSNREEWVGHVTHTGDKWGAYRVLGSRPEGKKPSWKT